MPGIKDKIVVITGASAELRKFSRAAAFARRGWRADRAAE
jgi:NADP-dependent 3-hydroxy acid dehydrogenase YdfG